MKIKKLILVLNRSINPGKVMNAIGHMTVGAAPRFPQDKRPVVDIYMASHQKVREFRAYTVKMHRELSEMNCLISDFAHTTTDGSAKDHEQQTLATSEANIDYFGAMICADQDDLVDLEKLLSSEEFSRLTYAENLIASEELATFDFSQPIEYPRSPTFTDERKKFSIALAKQATPETIMALFQATLDLGSKASRASLRLHQYPDADGTLHNGMSEYGLVALDAKTTKRLNQLDSDAGNKGLDAIGYSKNGKDELVALALFGDIDTLNTLTKKGIQLWKKDSLEESKKSTLITHSTFSQANQLPSARTDLDEQNRPFKPN